MTRKRDYISVVLGLALAAVFIYAAIEKIKDPLQFADSVAGFAMLPVALINLMALGLPPFEIATGILLIVPRCRRIGALAVVVATVIFITALTSALARGLALDCGCFGAGAPSRPRMWVELGFDIVLFSAAMLLYIRSIVRSLPQPA